MPSSPPVERLVAAVDLVTDLVITDLGVFTVARQSEPRMILIECAEGGSVEEIGTKTAANFAVGRPDRRADFRSWERDLRLRRKDGQCERYHALPVVAHTLQTAGSLSLD